MVLLYAIICIVISAFTYAKGFLFVKEYGSCEVIDYPEKDCSDICLSLKCSNDQLKQMTWKTSYLFFGDSSKALSGIFLFFTTYLALNGIIPVMLLIFFQIINLTYKFIIGADLQVYDYEKGKVCKVNNMNALEDLAQVNYMFCDKTGTLTKNELIFREMKLIDKDIEIPSILISKTSE